MRVNYILRTRLVCCLFLLFSVSVNGQSKSSSTEKLNAIANTYYEILTPYLNKFVENQYLESSYKNKNDYKLVTHSLFISLDRKAKKLNEDLVEALLQNSKKLKTSVVNSAFSNAYRIEFSGLDYNFFDEVELATQSIVFE